MGAKDGTAPLSVPCEVRAVVSRREGASHEGDAEGPRWFRLSTRIGHRGLTLRRPLPLELGSRVIVTLRLPAPEPTEPAIPVTIPGILEPEDTSEGPRSVLITFAALDDESRASIEAYLLERLGIAA